MIWKIGDLDMTDGGLRGPSGLKGGLKGSLKGKLNDFWGWLKIHSSSSTALDPDSHQTSHPRLEWSWTATSSAGGPALSLAERDFVTTVAVSNASFPLYDP